MVTSSKTTFRLETLQERALESMDERIASKHLEIAAFGDPNSLRQQRLEWRDRQEAAVSHLFSRLGGADLTDEELAQFRVEPLPEPDRYARDKAVRDLRALETRRSQVAAKAASLAADEDGTISLTKTQLKEFFDL